MNGTSDGPRLPRPFAEYRWTPDKATEFIRALAQHGKVAAAARSVGMTRQSAYRLRDRVPGMVEMWTRAQAVGRARRRGELSKAPPRPDQGDTSGGSK